MKRTRLVLGDKQTLDLLIALAYAIDTFATEDDDEVIQREENGQITAWRKLQEKVRAARSVAHRG